MEKHVRENDRSQSDLKDFVAVMFVEDMAQAREYEMILKANDIPAVVKEQLDPGVSNKNIAIMVTEDSLDEAHVVIESQDAYDDFYDLGVEDEGETDLDAGVFEDDF